jgi:hypothetical protein
MSAAVGRANEASGDRIHEQEWPSHGWTQQDVMSRILSGSVPYHWGQKDQAIPNNGWSNYAYFKVKEENFDRFGVFKQHEGELSAELYIDNAKAMHAISIPRAGLFYQDETTCMPDHIEAPGLEAELFLYILSEAFPDGPEKVNRKMSASVHGDTERTFRFMQAYGTIPPGWSAEVVLEPEAVSQYNISILWALPNEKPIQMTLYWEAKGGEVVSSSESLTNWLTCGYGSKSKSLQTFGQLRNELD